MCIKFAVHQPGGGTMGFPPCKLTYMDGYPEALQTVAEEAKRQKLLVSLNKMFKLPK